jgi:hypothetical protein
MQHGQSTTGYTLEGPAGTYLGRSGKNHPHTIAADALREATGTPWQRVEYRELERTSRGSVWEVEGMNDPDDRSGPYRLTIGDPNAADVGAVTCLRK